MTNTAQLSNYPTPTDIFTRLSELSEKTLKDNEAVFQQVKKDWDSVGLKYTSEGLRTVIREDSLFDADLDEVVFDVISGTRNLKEILIGSMKMIQI